MKHLREDEATPTSERTKLLRDDEREMLKFGMPSATDIAELFSRLIEARQVSEREKRQFAAQVLREAASEAIQLKRLGGIGGLARIVIQNWLNERAAALEAE